MTVAEPEPTTDEAPLWERLPDEPPAQYEAFRFYRDLSPNKRDMTTVAEQAKVSDRSIRGWAAAWNWRERAAAWDDERYRADDAERLELIRSMHSLHRRAGRLAITKAIQALQTLDVSELAPPAVARLMELGARLERSTLIVSVEELQGIEIEEDESEDPWERIAAELDPRNNTES